MECKPSSRFLEHSRGIFLIQGTKNAVPDLLVAISERLFRAVKFNGSSNHKTVEFRTLRGGRGPKYKITSMDFRRTGSEQFAGKIPQHKALVWKTGPRTLVTISSGSKDHLPN